MANTNFQENVFAKNDTQAKLGRSQRFALLMQALGDLNTKASLMAEITLGTHKFIREENTTLDEFKLEAVSFDLGYRRLVGNDFWVSGALGSMYPWRVTQEISSSATPNPESDFQSLYSAVFGIQYESEINKHPVSYDFRIRKYISSELNDQVAIGLSIGWRFGI